MANMYGPQLTGIETCCDNIPVAVHMNSVHSMGDCTGAYCQRTWPIAKSVYMDRACRAQSSKWKYLLSVEIAVTCTKIYTAAVDKLIAYNKRRTNIHIDAAQLTLHCFSRQQRREKAVATSDPVTIIPSFKKMMLGNWPSTSTFEIFSIKCFWMCSSVISEAR